MRKNRHLVSALLLAACALLPPRLEAATLYAVTVEGTLGSVDVFVPSNQPAFDSEFVAGDPFSLTFIYDGDTPQGGSTSGRRTYFGAVTGFTASLDGYAIGSGLSGANRTDLTNDAPGPLDLFSLFLADLTGDDIGTSSPERVTLSFQDTSATVFPDPGDPPPLSTPIDFSAFDQIGGATSLQFTDPAGVGEDQLGASITFDVTSIESRLIPEPTVLPLVGLAGLLTLRRRR